jgi:hypothetical protein
MEYKTKSSSLTFYKPDYSSDIIIPIASGNVSAVPPISASEEFADKLDILVSRDMKPTIKKIN